MMEFNDVLNRVLKGDPEGRRRGLRLRTYCVTCLNEVHDPLPPTAPPPHPCLSLASYASPRTN